VIPLPYADDIREVTIDPAPVASKEQIVKAKKMVKTLRIKFDSRNFENPGSHNFLLVNQFLTLMC
jgi:hypothetical protein